MRELSLMEIEMVNGAGAATDAVQSTVAAGTAGYAIGLGIATARGAVNGARFGVLGAIIEGAIGLAAGIYDAVKDGSDYNN